MRRFAFMVAALAPLFTLTACEDGPNQTYNPPPNGAGNVWNGPGSSGIPEGGAYSGNGSQQYDASFGGQNANVTCTADQAKATWTKYFQQPILPPGLGGGLDIAGGYNSDGLANYDPTKTFTYDETKETWVGATLEQAQALLCTATSDSIYLGVTSTAGWGNGCPSCELSALYNPNTRKITDLLFQYGYVGSMNATSTDGKTSYALALNNLPWTATPKGGSPQQVILNWSDTAALNKTANELYDAYRNTYAPTFPPDKDCQAAGHCIIGNNYTAGGYFWFTPLNVVMFVTNTLAAQPAASTITLVDLGLLKLLPFSVGNNMLKLDPEGPLSVTSNVASSGKTCTYKLGMNFGDFDTQCLEASSDATQNTIAKNKLYGAIGHSDEAYEFDIQGIDPQFVAVQQDNQVISDAQRPGPSDVAYQLTIDQEALGKIDNDWFKNDPTTGIQDYHGLGMITLEMANLVQKYMQANHGVTAEIGDPGCIANPANPGNGLVCSGIEGIVTTAPPVASDGVTPLVPANMAVNALGANALNVEQSYGVGLKPSTWVLDFCTVSGDPKTGAGYAGCEGGTYGGKLGGYYFDSIQWAVAQSFGKNPVPDDVASRRFYFKQFILAAIKYFQTASNYDATLDDIDKNPVDDNQVFFDSLGGGFESGNYVFRNNVNSGMQAPTVFNVGTNLTTSVVQNLTFARWNFRGDKALYNVLNQNPTTDQPGAEPLYIQNLAGSPVLQAVYGTGAAGYSCAINTSKTKCSGVIGPTDPLSGQPLFAPYGPAFGASFLNIAANNSAPSASPMQVAPKGYELIQSAMVTIPIWSNPFDPTTASPSDKTVSILMPFVPKGAGGGGEAGFPVTIDGSRDKFYNTNEIVLNSSENLYGTSLDYTVDWETVPVTTSNGSVQNQTVVRAIESQAYLGLIMACAQPSITVPGTQDILAVRMYDNAATILNWIAAHPGAQSSCGIQIKYSIYGNFADYISFLNNGVRLGLNPGFGGSVVSDGTIFDPNVIPSLGQ